MSRVFDVLVVGAGPAGLAAACRAAEAASAWRMVDDNPLGRRADLARRSAAAGSPAAWMRRAERHGVGWFAGARVLRAPGRAGWRWKSSRANPSWATES